MRIYKFRAWTGKEMLYPYNKDDNFETIDGHNKLEYRPISALRGDSNDYIWMQYTGLKDKNGKEIWEGDIVKREDKKWIGFVEWKNGSFVLFIPEKEQNKKDIFRGFRFFDLRINQMKLEVIGNIYENPKLIK